MSETRKINPLIALAAVSVTLFSLVGIGVMTGMMPSSFSKNSDSSLEAGAAKAVDAKTGAAPATAAKPQAKREAAKQPAQQAAVAPKAAPVCTSCGVVASVNAVTQKGEGSGLGAVAGGVLGGVLGNQIGGGSGKKIATVAGAAGGAYAGHQVEKNMKSVTHYDVVVNMDDGTTRTFSYDTQPAFQTGSKVRVVNGALTSG
ncbi:MAG: glycine zipper 2TM domain-containing protein [Burkholderiales bacterium]